MRHELTERLSAGEFIALYEQAQDHVVAWAKEAGQIPPGARSDEVIFEFGRRVERRVKQGLERGEDRRGPVVKEAAQEPVHASREEIRRAVREVSREVCGNE